MPDPIPAPAAPAAEPSPQPPQPPAQPSTRELAVSMANLLTRNVDDTPPAAPAPAAPAPAAPAALAPEKPIKARSKTPAAPAAPPEQPEARPPIPKKSDLNKGAPSAPAPAAPSPATPPRSQAEDDADFDSSLVEEEKALLEEAATAEKFGGERYKGHASKVRAFLKENARRVEAADFDENDPEYLSWVSSALPKVSPIDARRIATAQIREEVTHDIEPKLVQERQERFVEREEPKIRVESTALFNRLIPEVLPDEVMNVIKDRTKGITDATEYKKKVNEVEQEYALECEVTTSIVNGVSDDIAEFYRLTRKNPQTDLPIKSFDAANPQHVRLEKMVNDVCDEFKASGGKELKKDGKWFVTRKEWADMDPKQQVDFWTFNNEQIVERALKKVKPLIALTIEENWKHVKRYGLTRPPKTAPAAAPAAPRAPASAPPAPRPSPPPGGGQPAGDVKSAAAKLASKLLSEPATG